MDEFAQFEPIVPVINEEAIKYYKDNNLPLPSNTYFNDYFDVRESPEKDNFFTQSIEETHPLRNLTKEVLGIPEPHKVQVPLRDLGDLSGYDIVIGAKNSIADRHNNPGNLIFMNQKGASKGESRGNGIYWAKFNTPRQGFKALLNQVILDAGRGMTVDTFINKYAPSKENNTNRYVKLFSDSLNVDKDTKIATLNPIDIATFLSKIESSTTVLPK